MIEPTPYERFHWWLVNRWGRLTGWAFTAGGIVGALSCAPFLIPSDTASRPADFTPGDAGATILVCFGVTILGLLILKAKPYYPAHLREWFESHEHKGTPPPGP